ncbi:hypothetical protein [Kallotenue papyrolyticum]|uniref:hypothetical protein n=1 Tax=Kallotenue papyrolyticum TaxID=1325125 RepID=UPI0004785644|nr:hypothetical protein [Kallotenue papyrolyticum]
MIEYFTQEQPPFGRVSITMTLLWLVTLVVGLYLLRSYREANPVRLRFVRRVGLVTSILSALGLIALAFKLWGVPLLSWRLWSYLVALASLGYWAYALYFYLQRLPAQVTAAARTARRSTGARAYTAPSNGEASRAPRPPRPAATTTRRAARREKKRKTR